MRNLPLTRPQPAQLCCMQTRDPAKSERPEILHRSKVQAVAWRRYGNDGRTCCSRTMRRSPAMRWRSPPVYPVDTCHTCSQKNELRMREAKPRKRASAAATEKRFTAKPASCHGNCRYGTGLPTHTAQHLSRGDSADRCGLLAKQAIAGTSHAPVRGCGTIHAPTLCLRRIP